MIWKNALSGGVLFGAFIGTAYALLTGWARHKGADILLLAAVWLLSGAAFALAIVLSAAFKKGAR